VTRQEYGTVIWWVLGTGFAFGLLPRARLARPALLLIGALLAYAAWTAISLGWSVSSERTTAEIARVLDYVGIVLLIVSLLDRTTWRAAAMGLGFAALAVCSLAVTSRLAPFGANAFPGVNGPDRLSYPFGYWNAVGAWASMSMAIGLAWSAHDHVRARRVVALGLVPVAALAAYLSYSRASIGGAAVALVAVVAFSRNRLTALLHAATAATGAAIAIVAVRHAPEIANGTGTRGAGGVVGALAVAVAIAAVGAVATSVANTDRVRLGKNLARFGLATGIAVVVLFGAIVGPTVAKKAWHEFRHPALAQSMADPAARLTQLGGTRYFYWSAAFGAFKAKPFTGTGAGTFEFSWDQHGATGDFVRNAHSFELENMAELGIPGVLLMVAVMAAAVSLLARTRRRSRRVATAGASAALLAAFLVYLWQASVDWMWQSTAVSVLALGGAAVAAARLSRGRPRLRWYGRAGVALAAACAVVLQVPGLVSTAAVRRSQSAERAGDAALAYAWANAGVSAQPWAASPYEQRGLVLEAAGRLTPAAADLERAISREPNNFAHWLVLSRIETERGYLAAAARDYVRARELRPKAQVFFFAPYFSGQPGQPVGHG
jgi:uncharacterized membrane protein YtjA (UPF0391 family)